MEREADWLSRSAEVRNQDRMVGAEGVVQRELRAARLTCREG